MVILRGWKVSTGNKLWVFWNVKHLYQSFARSDSVVVREIMPNVSSPITQFSKKIHKFVMHFFYISINTLLLIARHQRSILWGWISTWPVIPECDLDFLLLSDSTSTFVLYTRKHRNIWRMNSTPPNSTQDPFPQHACMHTHKLFILTLQNSKHRKVGIKFEYHFYET